jgi:hypothetical protein
MFMNASSFCLVTYIIFLLFKKNMRHNILFKGKPNNSINDKISIYLIE